MLQLSFRYNDGQSCERSSGDSTSISLHDEASLSQGAASLGQGHAAVLAAAGHKHKSVCLASQPCYSCL